MLPPGDLALRKVANHWTRSEGGLWPRRSRTKKPHKPALHLRLNACFFRLYLLLIIQMLPPPTLTSAVNLLTLFSLPWRRTTTTSLPCLSMGVPPPPPIPPGCGSTPCRAVVPKECFFLEADWTVGSSLCHMIKTTKMANSLEKHSPFSLEKHSPLGGSRDWSLVIWLTVLLTFNYSEYRHIQNIDKNYTEYWIFKIEISMTPLGQVEIEACYFLYIAAQWCALKIFIVINLKRHMLIICLINNAMTKLQNKIALKYILYP